MLISEFMRLLGDCMITILIDFFPPPTRRFELVLLIAKTQSKEQRYTRIVFKYK